MNAMDDAQHDIAELADTVARLRVALEIIILMSDKTLIAPSLGPDCDRAHQLGANKAFEQAADIARAALEKS